MEPQTVMAAINLLRQMAREEREQLVVSSQ